MATSEVISCHDHRQQKKNSLHVDQPSGEMIYKVPPRKRVEIESCKFQVPSAYSLKAISLCLRKSQLWLNRINTESSGDF